ncbi:hypothetical protein Tco_1334985 [Tanacetum coccineum]
MKVRNITRERYNLRESVADVILDSAWNLPHAWFDVYPILNQTNTPVLVPNKEDQVVWRTSEGLIKEFVVLEAQQNQNPEAGQTSMGRDGQIFMYNLDYLREQSCGFGDSRGLHSTTLTIEQTTRCSRTLCNQDTLM